MAAQGTSAESLHLRLHSTSWEPRLAEGLALSLCFVKAQADLSVQGHTR